MTLDLFRSDDLRFIPVGRIRVKADVTSTSALRDSQIYDSSNVWRQERPYQDAACISAVRFRATGGDQSPGGDALATTTTQYPRSVQEPQGSPPFPHSPKAEYAENKQCTEPPAGRSTTYDGAMHLTFPSPIEKLAVAHNSLFRTFQIDIYDWSSRLSPSHSRKYDISDLSTLLQLVFPRSLGSTRVTTPPSGKRLYAAATASQQSASEAHRNFAHGPVVRDDTPVAQTPQASKAKTACGLPLRCPFTGSS